MRRLIDPRRRRAEIVLVLVVALLSSFSIACVGGDTPEVQEPVNQTKTNYEEFLRQAGVFAGSGKLVAPWIVAPEQGAEVAGEFEISGWSMRPSDVVGTPGYESAFVRIFIVPATVYEQTREYRGYEVTSATRAAPVDSDTGAWSFAATSLADTYKGDCVLVAVAQVGGLESPPTVLTFTSADGDSKGGGQTWPEPVETIYLATAMVRPKGDVAFEPGSEERLRRLVEDVGRYYRDASRGRVEIKVIDELGLWEIEQTDKELAADEKVTGVYLKHILAALERVPERPGPGEIFTIVAAQPGPDDRNNDGRSTHSVSWYPDVMPDEAANRGSFINLPMDQGESQDMIGVLAHEIAHGLGSFPVDGRSALPDLYEAPKDGYTPADFNNFDWPASRGTYFLMAQNRAVNPCAYSQEWLGWLDYQDVPLGSLDDKNATVRVPYLDGLLGTVGTVPRIVWAEADGREAYTIIEGRTNTRGSWDVRLPNSGLLVYKVREAKPGERLDWQVQWPRSINWCARLGSGNSEFYDLAEGYVVRLDGTLTQGAAEEVQLLPAVSVGDVVSRLVNPLVGAVLRVAIPQLPQGASSAIEEAGVESTRCIAPDLDLHAYLADGTHIGMNYETGNFENPVEGAIVSGDMVLDSEWIVLPENLRVGARFEVSSHDAQEYVESMVDGTEVQDLSLDYDVQPVALDVVNGAIARGESVAGSLGPGLAASTSLQGGALRLQPLRPADGAAFELPAAVWELIAAAVLLVLGLVVLAVPARRR